MMNQNESVSAQQLGAFLFLCGAVELAVRPFTSEVRAGAQVTIPAAALCAAAVILLLKPVLRAVRNPYFDVLKSGVGAGCKVFLALCAVLFTVACAAASLHTARFIRYVSAEPVSQITVTLLAAFCVLYALRCGLEGIIRTFGLVQVIFCISFFVLLISNLGSMHFVNLGAAAFSPKEIFSSAYSGLILMPELVLFFLLAGRQQTDTKKTLFRVLMCLTAFYMVLTFFTELVIGAYSKTQMQTVHTLSRLGSISVFRRMDAVHSTVWVLAELCRIAVLASGTAYALRALFKIPAHRHTAEYAAAALILPTACAISSVQENTMTAALTAGTAALLLYAVCACRIMEAMYAEKES